MKKTLPTSGKARSTTGYHRHLDKKEQRRANRGTRQAFKKEDHRTGSADYSLDYTGQRSRLRRTP